jgi:hypothetical protein
MEKISTLRSRYFASLLALICFASFACQKKSPEAQDSSPSTDQTRPSVEIQPAPGPVQPATVGREEGSFANHVHFPKDPAVAKMDSIVQFYCDISSEGAVETTHAVIGSNEEFKRAVQSALDWGRFKPASLDGKPTPVYLGGSVLFMHQDGQPIIVVSLATADRDRIGKLAHYVQPQLIGGLRHHLQAAEANASIDLPYQGASEVLVKVDEHGKIASTNVVSENPKDIGLGDFLAGAIKDGRFTPAYSEGKQTAGAVNVIANFGEF